MAINKEWHRSNRMPPKSVSKAATRAQRIAWHVAHATACGCRAIPESIRADVQKLLKSRRKP
ncbi:hypothetical protein JQ596_06615 [Bradyrhizobium manausense]|uniref:hypothetical protein n=1 Tax=Bradyrhizobium TaxID=374 RepID=UPI001BA97BDA|nr:MULTISPECIES: hypothetical protein [Bradyrhizobium]MBR0825200.1 hypothetical protein [Bradyrhizobium manausense]UVO28388.1 hypothetical protein KUF59_39025 [Bradyrhizobium arachidis]